MLANTLKAMNINKPVYKIRPWVNLEKISKHAEPPFGKIASFSDSAMRSTLRLMASEAVVVVPDPFDELIIDGLDGLTYIGKLTDDKFAELQNTLDLEEATKIATRASEKARHLCDPTRYLSRLADIFAGNCLNHNEPWIKTDIGGGHRWIIPKEGMVNGEVVIVPEKFDPSFKIMKCLSLDQIFEYFSRMRFVDVYVYDALIEPLSNDKIGKINKLLKILGTKSKNIFFCMDAPEEWAVVNHNLVFMSASDASKRM